MRRLLLISVAWPALLSVPANATNDVDPINWIQFSTPATLSANAQLNRDIVRHFDWDILTNEKPIYDAKSRTAIGYIDFGGTGENLIRPPAFLAFPLAASLATGAYDASVTGVSEVNARAFAIDLLASVAAAHKANTSGGFGDHWQSALWSGSAGMAGWLLWDHLAPADRDNVAAMVAYEANRFNNVTPPSWNGSGGDSKTEENSWNATLLDLAVNMMPGAPNASLWLESAIRYRLSAVARPSDVSNGTVINGSTYAEWITGYNIYENGSVTNHSLSPHGTYAVATMKQNGQALIAYSLAGMPTPESVRTNLDAMYANLVFQNWTTSQGYVAPGGTFYQSDGTIYWPVTGETERRFRYDLFGVGDTLVEVLGQDLALDTDASEWVALHFGLTQWAQQNPTAANAQYSGTGFGPAHNAATAWLANWLSEQGAVSISNAAPSFWIPEPPQPPGLRDYSISTQGNLVLLDSLTVEESGNPVNVVYHSTDFIGIDVNAFTGGTSSNRGGILVPDGAAVPLAGQRATLLDVDRAINTGLANVGTGVGSLVVTFNTPLVNHPGFEVVLVELQGNDSFTVTKKDGGQFPVNLGEFQQTTGEWAVDLYGGLDTLAAMESATSFSTTNTTIPVRPMGIVLLDLSDLGYAEGETVSSLAIASTTGYHLDPMFIAGLPEKASGYEAAALAISDPALRGFDDDADGDGLSNGAEHGLGTSLTVSNGSPVTMQIVGGKMAITFPRDPAKADVGYVAEFSFDLSEWREVWSSATAADGNNASPDMMEVFDNHPDSATATQCFARIRFLLFTAE